MEWENLADKYMRVRHEDFSMEPFKVAEDIYRFIGIKMTTGIKSWLGKNTDSNTARIVTSTWRNKLDFEHNKIIQSYCGDVLQKLNYRSFASEQDMHNFNISSF